MADYDCDVVIIGAGPAGLLLAHLLDEARIETVVLEARSEDYALSRIRAGVLEQGTVDLLVESGVGGRLQQEGMPHDGIELRSNGVRHHIDVRGLTGGRGVTVYGQQEVVKDLIAAQRAAGRRLLWESPATRVDGADSGRPVVRYVQDGEDRALRCRAVAGCDGFHGIARAAIPASERREYRRDYPFAWLGVLADVAPSTDEIIYAYHDAGFALHSMRSATVSRLYVQCAPDDRLEEWSDDRVWTALHERFGTEGGWSLTEGPVLDKGITPMRSFVSVPMQHGRLFLAGDAAHIVPPTGAKGLNLAVRDVALLAETLSSLLLQDDEETARVYTDRALGHIWRAVHFADFLATTLHVFPEGDAFQAGLQRAQMEYLFSSAAAATSFAENYVGYGERTR